MPNNSKKNGKAKMNNKLMRAKEVFKSSSTVGKIKPTASANAPKAMKEIDSQLMQMRERQMRQGKKNVAGKAQIKTKEFELQPSILHAASQPVAEVEPPSLAELLLQGEASQKLKNTIQNSESHIIDGDNPSNRGNMFGDLSDDDEEGTSKYQLKLQPSLWK
jgi:hypothetical protein